MLSSFHLDRWAKGEELYISKYRLLFCRAYIVFFLSDEAMKLARCPKKIELGRHLIQLMQSTIGRLMYAIIIMSSKFCPCH
jgi:hypothetical protein